MVSVLNSAQKKEFDQKGFILIRKFFDKEETSLLQQASYKDKNIKKILRLKSPFIEKSIYKSCIIKKNVVEKDFKEKNLRKILNFGHTFGHAYESALGYSSKLNHGEAVILGISLSLIHI